MKRPDLDAIEQDRAEWEAAFSQELGAVQYVRPGLDVQPLIAYCRELENQLEAAQRDTKRHLDSLHCWCDRQAVDVVPMTHPVLGVAYIPICQKHVDWIEARAAAVAARGESE